LNYTDAKATAGKYLSNHDLIAMAYLLAVKLEFRLSPT
jgi:hypothetical protein